ncbi:MAG: hypothetical protein GEU98_13585 [Pseudonocardiaceae bacterium]|nr:hypothetical protein [Pseudonocardiaceae bacterium]
MLIWDYVHHIEYRRELSKGRRIHEYTEYADDMGFCLEHRAERKQDWLVKYTRYCTEDFLGRMRAAPGTWVVSVYRACNGDERTHLVTIRMRWPGSTDIRQ